MVSAQPATPIRGTSLVGREGKLCSLILEANGRPSASGNAEAAGFAANAASAADDLALRALPEAMSRVGTALSVLAGNQPSSEGAITARVVGARRLGQLAPLRQALERIPGVDAVELRRVLPGIPATIEARGAHFTSAAHARRRRQSNRRHLPTARTGARQHARHRDRWIRAIPAAAATCPSSPVPHEARVLACRAARRLRTRRRPASS